MSGEKIWKVCVGVTDDGNEVKDKALGLDCGLVKDDRLAHREIHSRVRPRRLRCRELLAIEV